MSDTEMPFMKKGKKPVPEKKYDPEVVQDLFGDPLKVPPEIAKDIKDRGFEQRWIDAKHYVDNRGFHKRGWVVYKIPENLKIRNRVLLGNDPDQTLRHGTIVLAVRDKRLGDQHRAELESKRRRYKMLPGQQINSIREQARKAGIDTKLPEDD